MWHRLKGLKAAALVEYGILAGLIALIAVFAVSSLGARVGVTFEDVSNTMSTYIKDAASQQANRD